MDVVIRLLGRPHTIDVIAVTISDGVEVDQRGKLIEEIGNNMISILRLTYDPSVDIIRRGDEFLTFFRESDSPEPAYEAVISFDRNENYIVNVQNIAAVFCETADTAKARIFSLLAEAQTPAIPIHYRCLSLI